MPRKRLSERNVLSLSVKSRPYRVWDSGTDSVRGLHVLVQPSGTRTYRVLYRLKGSPREYILSLGRVGIMTLDEARDAASEALRTSAKGNDPTPKADDTEAPSDTLKATIEVWTKNEQIGRKRVRDGEGTEKFVLTSTKGLHGRPIASLRYADIDDLLCEMRDGSKRRRAAPYAANRMHAHLKTFFRWCVRTKRLVASPIAEMPRPWLGAEPRDRPWFKGAAADDAIAKLWRCADEIGGDRGRYVKLLLMTGKRRRAIEYMRWEQIDDTWWWSPPKGSKTKRCHAIPLPKLAQRVLSPREEAGRVCEVINSESLCRSLRTMIELDDFFWHGVKHIVETKMGELRVPPHIRDMVLDHAPQRGAGNDYDHGTYRTEQLEALELWCAHIERLVAPAEGVAVLR